MLEILILIRLGQSISRKARAKGRSGPGFVVLLLVLWFGGELAGAIVAAVALMATTGDEEPALAVCYVGALIGAIIGALIAFAVVNNVGPAYRRDYEGEYEDDDFDRDPRDR